MEQSWSFRYQKPSRPDGPLVELSAAEAEQILLDRLNEKGANRVEALWNLACLYSRVKRQDKAVDCLRQVMELQSDPEAKAGCILAMGQLAEQVGDYESAIRFYKEAFSLEPAGTRTWYLIHNNLGFSLNTLGRFSDGEPYCRKATQIDGSRSNAFKNLGISLEGQGKLNEAAQCFITATRVNASDRRAFDLLEQLLHAHPELQADFATEVECCKKAVEFAAREVAKDAPLIHRGMRKQIILFKSKLRAFFNRFKATRNQ